jgi:AmiR/NasT family two-component response regulator
MTVTVVKNFRGARALVCHADDPSRVKLVATLARLGLEVILREPGSDEPRPAAVDIVFFDADEEPEAAPEPLDVPLVALIGVEAPSRLARVLRRRAAAYIIKPVRASGVYTALVVAFSEHARRKAEAEEREAVASRLAGRRDLFRALLHIMRSEGVDDDTAFRHLRRESMRRRLPVETVAREIVASLGEIGTVAPGGDGTAQEAINKQRREA